MASAANILADADRERVAASELRRSAERTRKGAASDRSR